MSSPLPPRRLFAYILSVILILIGAAGFFLRHYLFCGILSLFIFSIGFAWFILMILKDRAPKKVSRFFSILFHICFTIFLISFLIVEIPVVNNALKASTRDDTVSEEIGIILVPGAGLIHKSEKPSLLFALRLRKAEALYKEDESLKIVICGGQGDDEVIAEADAGRKYLLSRGLPAEAVIAETESLDTAENFQNFRTLFPYETLVALVTNDFHIYRCSLLARRYGLEVEAYSMPTPNFFLRVNYFMREYVSLIIFAIESQGIIIDTSNFHI